MHVSHIKLRENFTGNFRKSEKCTCYRVTSLEAFSLMFNPHVSLTNLTLCRMCYKKNKWIMKREQNCLELTCSCVFAPLA